MTRTVMALVMSETADSRFIFSRVPAARANATDRADRLAYTVPEVADALGVSRSHGYELVRRGLLPAVELGGRTLIPRLALLRHLERLVRQRAQGANHSAGQPDAPPGAETGDAGGWSWTCGCGTFTVVWLPHEHHG